MKYTYLAVFCLIILFSCKTKKFPYKYVTYVSEAGFKLPSEKVELIFNNDSTAYFINYIYRDNIFKQEFRYSNTDTNFICIKSVDTINMNIVSLKVNDTIVKVKDKMYFLFRGKEKFLLYFKKEN